MRHFAYMTVPISRSICPSKYATEKRGVASSPPLRLMRLPLIPSTTSGTSSNRVQYQNEQTSTEYLFTLSRTGRAGPLKINHHRQSNSTSLYQFPVSSTPYGVLRTYKYRYGTEHTRVTPAVAARKRPCPQSASPISAFIKNQFLPATVMLLLQQVTSLTSCRRVWSTERMLDFIIS